MNSINVTTGCHMIGEFVDESEQHVPDHSVPHGGEIVRTHMVADFLDPSGSDDDMKDFIVLLKDGRSAVVPGHGLKNVEGNFSFFSIHVRKGDEDVTVALFPIAEVSGIFHGELRTDRKIA